MLQLLVFDVGSTFTKVTGFLLQAETLTLVATAKAPTTVQDIRLGLDASRNNLQLLLNQAPVQPNAPGSAQSQALATVQFLPSNTLCYASSSAAGGLRMVALGFMPRVTAKAAKEVAMNAGARVLEVVASDLPQDPEDFSLRVQVLSEIKPDIILLSGGTDGGDTASIISHAHCVVKAVVPGWEPMTIIAGNREAQTICAGILLEAGLKFTQVPNILPNIHELKVAPARAAIHQEFIRQITKAKGLSYLQEMVENKDYLSSSYLPPEASKANKLTTSQESKPNAPPSAQPNAQPNATPNVIIPTPAAVLMGAELLAKGYQDTPGFGGLMIIDLGGATTDIHSVIPELDDLAIEERGLIISNEKQISFRTVEGNLGMRVSACGIVETLSPTRILNFADPVQLQAALGISTLQNLDLESLIQQLQDYTIFLEKNPDYIVDYSRPTLHSVFDQCLATAAIFVALRRHAGVLAAEANPVLGIIPGMPSGRDTRQVKNILAVGGIFTHLNPQQNQHILKQAFASPGLSLLPVYPEFIIDTDYLLYTLGVLSSYYPKAALNFGLKHFKVPSKI